MADSIYDRINDYGSVKISLASPNDIRSWSFGEVRKPETINYRTYRPERDGLFCERIFGPERDWECGCGKYKGTKHKGIICDRCQVKVTHSRVRRKRMGHINLAAPIVHIWFFKAMPSRLGTLLDMKTSSLEKIIYFHYVVTDPGGTPLKEKQLLTEEEYREARKKYGMGFEAMMGAESIKVLLEQLDLNLTAMDLREAITQTNSKQKIKELTKRLRLIEAVRGSGNDPSWVVFDVIPVIPPDLRPLVLLESGNFATSDLNDLYRRIINRNNRLKKLVDLNAPEVIIQNEKRMLQQAVDALFDNGRCRRPVLGSSNRPLKSLTDMIKGKQGRFRENLLGKRVDYSARSVIVVGPELKLNQCGLPKKIALELYQPFIIRRLKERGLADTIKSAKKMLERRDQEIWDILEQVIYQHPVLLNRAPTLHRMGIQAFEPVLVEGNAIRIHPLACKGFNADFDGDQMAVHLPLSVEAQAEAHVLMMSTNNIFSPANGSPIMSPSQDMVLGIFYLTTTHTTLTKPEDSVPVYSTVFEAIYAYEAGHLSLHDFIEVRIPERDKVVNDSKGSIEDMPENRRIRTTVGRLLFNDILAPGMPFYNCALSQKGSGRVIADCHQTLGRGATIELLDEIKSIGFRWSTLAGLSFAISDLRVPYDKTKILDAAQKKVDEIEKGMQSGSLTPSERYNQLIDIWIHAREEVTASMLKEIKNDWRDAEGHYVGVDSKKGKPYMNPVFLMTESGARGSTDQIRQLAGMRALMAKPSGEIIETPIKANFREGLSVLEYFSSTHGARKGLADTALKTADSGYLTRKLADVAQNVIVNQIDCGTINGIAKEATYRGEEIEISLKESIVGRIARDSIRNMITDEMIVAENDIITPEIAKRIEDLGLDKIRVRSPLTCESPLGLCARCYGVDMSTGKLVEEGMAVGIIGAQSIGEPGTQLTMRTFHTGGVASRAVVDNTLNAMESGTIQFRNLSMVTVPEQGEIPARDVVLKRNGEVVILDDKEREVEAYKVPYGAELLIKAGDKVSKGDPLVTWDPHLTPILAEVTGFVRFQDIAEGETVRAEQDKVGARFVVIEHKGEKHPQIVIEDDQGNVLNYHYLPAKARIEVSEGQHIQPGMLLARQPQAMSGTQDITGGLPRVTEIFEARKPKEPAVMAEISGKVEIRADKRRGKMTIIVRSDSGMEKEHHVPQDKQLRVHAGDTVEAGDQLIEGPLVPAEILKIRGEQALQDYLLGEVQSVYRSQNVTINDKHVEVILAQMLRRVKIVTPGDSDFLPGEVVDKFRFRAENDRLAKSVKIDDPGDTNYAAGAVVLKSELEVKNEAVEDEGGEPAKGKRPKPASAETQLLGITKASLQSESFISAASFQETTKVLTEQSLAGATDPLIGLKENVILGHLIPAGTAFKPHQDLRVKKLAEPLPEEEDIAADMIAPTGGVMTAADLAYAGQTPSVPPVPGALMAGGLSVPEVTPEVTPEAGIPQPGPLGMPDLEENPEN